MMKDVIISIKGTQGLNEETDTIEFTTDGRFGEKDGSYLITYDESEILGMKNVKTCLYVKPDNSVILQRSGTVQSRLVVEEGRRSTCFYSTPQGDLLIGIFGETVKHDLKKNGGSISMKYTIDSNLNLISRNTVNITVKEVNKNVNFSS